ncbi:hypothetical protein [Streptomyces chattanoogensis]|uniref:Secreted protein n=1 Tax=Streptomyces chattanoogensis TaxID=66876 RepID=A0A0N0GV19_9ACTN|nr:hypothetical protein [Streptomyces chattanoogensis]KPC58921.1 hypothetical protein ADL29_37760 [Streptomyces chattanoogensis]
MEVALAIFALLFVLFVAAGIFVTVKAVKAAKRGVDRTVAQARRTVEDTGLRARRLAQPGVVGELAQLRLSLRTSMRATQEVLRAGSADDASLAESTGLFERLSVHGHELDDELRCLEREPDRATIAARLPDLRERMERITHSAESLRWAARDRARKFADDDLAALSDQIDVEAGALRHWTREPVPESASDPAGEPTAKAAAADGLYSWGPVGEETPAITARDPHARPGYPWEKKPEAEGVPRAGGARRAGGASRDGGASPGERT